MHPEIQLKFCDFYEEYHDLILYYTNLSKQSLRYPTKTVTSFFKAGSKGSSEQGVEEDDKNYANFISFFKYAKYPFLYKFYESYDYNKLEKKFTSLVQVDVSSCFHNIYTHSISWAVKNKLIAKRDKGNKESFDNKFDILMQNSNYSETNGILIGPEISRIFAEIIFQNIDNKIISTLRSKDIKIKKDYDFRRYVDDYFIYFNNEQVKKEIIDVVNAKLFDYKMSLNEAKTIVLERPFITNITAFKHDISAKLDELYEQEQRKQKLKNNIGSKANKIITKFKLITKKHDVSYFSVSNYCAVILHKKITKVTSDYKQVEEEERNEEAFISWLLVDIDIAFFIHAMDPRVVPTDKLAKIILEIIQLGREGSISPSNFELVCKKIFDLSRKAIEIFDSNPEMTYSIESLNMLLLLSEVEKNKLHPNFIEQYFIKNISKDEIDDSFYFLWCSLMLYIKDDKDYTEQKIDLINIAKEFFKNNIHKFESTAFLLFWCDFLSCPYVEETDKIEVIEYGEINNISSKNAAKNYLRTFNNSKGLCVDWKSINWLSRNIDKKIYQYAYE